MGVAREKQQSVEPRAAKHGEKMLEVRLRFWTNNMAPGGKIIPKHAWTRGIVTVQRNEAHGIIPTKDTKFNSLLGLTAAIEAVFKQHGIKLVPSRRERVLTRDRR